MKFYHEVEELLRAFQGREFKKAQIVRYVVNGRKLDRKARHAVRVGVWRVLIAMRDIDVIAIRPATAKLGGPAWYAWKVSHALVAERH